jgi:hypothetical protein
MSETTPSPYLTIRFEGPEIKPGRMRLDDFVQAAKEFSYAQSAWPWLCIKPQAQPRGGVPMRWLLP